MRLKEARNKEFNELKQKLEKHFGKLNPKKQEEIISILKRLNMLIFWRGDIDKEVYLFEILDAKFNLIKKIIDY